MARPHTAPLFIPFLLHRWFVVLCRFRRAVAVVVVYVCCCGTSVADFVSFLGLGLFCLLFSNIFLFV